MYLFPLIKTSRILEQVLHSHYHKAHVTHVPVKLVHDSMYRERTPYGSKQIVTAISYVNKITNLFSIELYDKHFKYIKSIQAYNACYIQRFNSTIDQMDIFLTFQVTFMFINHHLEYVGLDSFGTFLFTEIYLIMKLPFSFYSYPSQK